MNPCRGSADNCVLGTVTVGERGQVVIPADVRKKLDIHTGDKMLIMSHPNGDGLIILKIDAFREFLHHLVTGLTIVEAAEAGTENDSADAHMASEQQASNSGE